MDVRRRKFLGQMSCAGLGVGVAGLSGCNSGGSRSVGGSRGDDSSENGSPSPVIVHTAFGRWQYDSESLTLNLQFDASDFPAECEPQTSDGYQYKLRALLGDAMYWLVEDAQGNARLMQWLRTPAASEGAAGRWQNGGGYTLTLDEGGALTLTFVSDSSAGEAGCAGYGFAGVERLPLSPFQQGVASGDPQANSLILWTRDALQQGHRLRYQLAQDPLFETLLQSGEIRPAAESDYTAKVIVTGLAAGQRYYYRFETVDHKDQQGRAFRSLVGRAQTLPASQAAVDSLTFAVVSCSSYPHGFFNAYRQVARHDDLDYVLHLGDYIYEYPGVDASDSNDYGDQQAIDQGRVYPSDNRIEPVSLVDYRRRHQHYKEDADLQLLHSRYAFITTWDDHETTDNSWDPDGKGEGGGAVNHQNTEGGWEQRKAAGVQAYDEWMPIAPIADARDPQIHRAFSFGTLGELMVLDTRIQGRHRQPNIYSDAYDDPERRLITAAQEEWLKERLSKAQRAGRRWKLLGQQVMMAQLAGPPTGAGEPPGHTPLQPMSPQWLSVMNTDQWDGYAANRQRIWDHVAAEGIDNLLVLTGDIHTSWAMELVQDPLHYHDPVAPTARYGVEFVTPSITSPGLPATQGLLESAVKAANPHIQYANLHRRGYLILTLTPEEAVATWYHVESILERENEQQQQAARYRVAAGSNRLESAG